MRSTAPVAVSVIFGNFKNVILTRIILLLCRYLCGHGHATIPLYYKHGVYIQ